jgi:hypothetical protein
VTITSDEAVTQTVTVAATDPQATEAGLTTGTFTFTRTGNTASALSVAYTVSGSATAGVDYASLGTGVTFPAAVASVTRTVTPLQDSLQEPDKSVTVTLQQAATYAVGTPNSATVTITSDEAVTQTVTVAATDPQATEAGLTTGTFTFTRTGSTTAPLTVTYTVGGRATPGGDYVALSTTVTFAAGAASATKTVTPIDDTLMELDEGVVVTLTPNSAYAVATPSSATVTLTSNEPVTQTVTVVATARTANEASLVPGTFTFTRTGSATSGLTVAYAVTGTATSGVDYVSLGTSVSFPAGVASVTKTVTPLQDALQEVNETVIVTLLQSTSYAVGIQSSDTVTLLSDDF